MSISKTKVSELYVSLFGRAAEGEGSRYWSSVSGSTADIANSMLSLQVVKDYFGVSEFSSEASVRKVVETIYLNTLNKSKDGANGTETDADGIQYWIDSVLVNGSSMGQMVENLVYSARDPSNAGSAQDTFINKVTVSEYAADHLDAFTTFKLFQNYISNVDASSESLALAKSLINSINDGTHVLSSEGTFSLQFNTGGSGEDYLISLGVDNSPVILGFEGNDALHSGSGDKSAILLGGDGNDQYHIEGLFGTYVIVDSGGNDTLHIPVSSTEIDTLFTVNGGDILAVYAEDEVNIILPGWQNSAKRIDTFAFNDKDFNYSELVEIITASSEGDFNISRLIEDPVVTIDLVSEGFELVNYLSGLNAQEFGDVLSIDLTGVIGSEALIDFLF
ncbi:MAG: hypothetical protein P1U52_04625 [Porticoccaceae bacterium]|nr:hypothetical protein [Porticoccaceae bacterium]